jgi:hypothetical protein
VEIGLQSSIDSKAVTETVAILPNVVSAEKIDDKKLKIVINGGLDAQKQLLRNLVQLDIDIISYKSASSELEDVYLKLIKDTM